MKNSGEIILRSVLSTYRWIFARKPLHKLNLVLFQLSLRGLGILNCEDKASGEDYFLTRILPSMLQCDNPVFFDVGSKYWELQCFSHK